ncbi:MAG: hypothetical protein K2X66_07480, partial [Cyanobacteria bacterium]|nr:hypothetical protein [Cyanobacteriota bacterium]
MSFVNSTHILNKNEEPTLNEGKSSGQTLYTVSSPDLTPLDLEHYHKDGAILIKGLMDNQAFDSLKVELSKRLELLEARYSQSVSSPT